MKSPEVFADKLKKGFTLIEALVVIGIGIVLAAATIPVVSNFQLNSQFDDGVTEFIQAVRLAQIRAIAGFDDASHGVFLESQKYTLYQGESWATRDSSFDQVYTLHSTLQFSSTIVGGDINFLRGLGTVVNVGDVTIEDAVSGVSKTFKLNVVGSIVEQ